MKLPPWNIIRITSLTCCLLTASALAAPIDFGEVSLLVRAHENERAIIQEVSGRKLAHALTPQQESTLKKQGASDSLIQALRAPAAVLSAADASAYEAQRQQAQKVANGERAPRFAIGGDASEAPGDLHVFDVSVGYPVNLSQWGGPDYEFAFHAPTRLDEGREDAVMIDNVRSGTHVATYLGAGRPDDDTTVFDRRNYVSVMDHSFTRGVRIDRKHPVSVKGSPYTLYPVYAAGGVSLYYIGSSSDSVRLAVRTSRFR